MLKAVIYIFPSGKLHKHDIASVHHFPTEEFKLHLL